MREENIEFVGDGGGLRGVGRGGVVKVENQWSCEQLYRFFGWLNGMFC